MLEHASVTMYLTGALPVARPRADPAPALLLQPAVAALRAAWAMPPSSSRRSSPGTRSSHEAFLAATDAALAAHRSLLDGMEKALDDVPNATLRRKQALQAANSVLPTATETRLVVTGNYRAWRHFIAMRASEHADVEIRRLALACLRELQRAAPHVFQDFRISTLADGTEVAASPYVTEG